MIEKKQVSVKICRPTSIFHKIWIRADKYNFRIRTKETLNFEKEFSHISFHKSIGNFSKKKKLTEKYKVYCNKYVIEKWYPFVKINKSEYYIFHY